MEYIDYLRAAGYLRNETEDLDLGDLQGAQGLKALRVTVDTLATRTQNQVLPEIVTAAIKALPKRANASS